MTVDINMLNLNTTSDLYEDLGANLRPDLSAYWSVDLHGDLGVVLDGDYNAKLNTDLMSIDIDKDVTNGPFSVDLGRH